LSEKDMFEDFKYFDQTIPLHEMPSYLFY
jgi:hypothetical protein